MKLVVTLSDDSGHLSGLLSDYCSASADECSRFVSLAFNQSGPILSTEVDVALG